MFVACSTLCFARLSLDDALRTAREMRFAKADLAIHEAGPHLKPSEVAADAGKLATRLKAGNLPFAAFHLDFGDLDGPTVRTRLKAVCRLARQLAVPLVTVPAAPAGGDPAAEVARLKEWAAITAADGVMLSVETHSATLTADPAAAADLCRRVPGLALTLDPSHYMLSPAGPANYDGLFPFVKHVRLRDTGHRADQFQVRVGQGEIEYGRVITQLERCRYDRTLTVDVRDLPDNPFPVEPEVRKLKYLLESQV